MSQTKLEQIVEEIIGYIDSCKPQTFSQTNIIVRKDILSDYLDELRRRTPDEIKRYQRIIANRDQIIAQAEESARKIEEDAKARAAKMIEETEIMIQARAEANNLVMTAKQRSEEMIETAKRDHENIRTGILCYSKDMLSVLEDLLQDSYAQTKTKADALVSEFEQKLAMVQENKREVEEMLIAGSPFDEGQDISNDVEYTDADFEFNQE